MSGEPLYERVGREPMTDAELEAAIMAWRSDHPDPMDALAGENRLRNLNREAHKRQHDEREARKAGTTAAALRQARAEKKARDAADRQARDLATAREFLGGIGPAVRRSAGRPGWTQATFHAAYREARDRAGGPAALDKEIAAAWPISLKRFQALVRRFGRPL